MKTKVSSLVLILLISAACSLFGSPPQQSAKDQLPTGSLFSAEELAKGFGSHQFTPFGDPKFSLEILVPAGWESHLSDYDPGQLSHDTESPVPMIEFYPNGADDLGVNVQYMRVPGDKPVSALVDVYAKSANGAIAARQQLDLPERKVEDVLMKTTDDSLGPVLNRVMVFRRGDIVFIATAWSVEEKYEQYKKVFATVREKRQRHHRRAATTGPAGAPRGRLPDEDHRRLPGPSSESCDGFPPRRYPLCRHCLERRGQVREVQEGFRHRSGFLQSHRKIVGRSGAVHRTPRWKNPHAVR